jgi:hypothetical protein
VRFSVYNYTTKVYDYYEGHGPSGTHATAPPIGGQTEVGATVEQAAWKVPPGAKRVGSGVLPQGRVATMGGIGDVMIGGSSLSRIAVVSAIVYLAWRHFR